MALKLGIKKKYSTTYAYLITSQLHGLDSCFRGSLPRPATLYRPHCAFGNRRLSWAKEAKSTGAGASAVGGCLGKGSGLSSLACCSANRQVPARRIGVRA